MLSEGPPRPAVSPRLFAPIDMRVAPLFCLLLLTAACVLASFAFACATPFAAFAAFAGSLRRIAGRYGRLYRQPGHRLWRARLSGGSADDLWGAPIGVAAFAATAISAQVPRLLPTIGRAAALSTADWLPRSQ